MKRSIIALLVLSVSSTAFAGSFDQAVSNRDAAHKAAAQSSFNHAVANENYSRTGSSADAMTAAQAEADKHTAANAYQSRDKAVSGAAMRAQVTQQQAAQIASDAAATATRQAAQDAANAIAVDKNAQARSLANYGVKGNPNLVSQVQPSNAPVSYSGTTQRPGVSGSINVAASSLAPSTPVSATINGVTTQTTAGEIAKVAPQTQVAVPHVDALIVSQRQGSDHSRNSSRSEHGTGNGGNNAANSNSAHGLGGGNHIGGGSAQSGSRSVGHW